MLMMNSKYNVGEPVCLYVTVEGISRNRDQEIVYHISYVDDTDEEHHILWVNESELTTVF